MTKLVKILGAASILLLASCSSNEDEVTKQDSSREKAAQADSALQQLTDNTELAQESQSDALLINPEEVGALEAEELLNERDVDSQTDENDDAYYEDDSYTGSSTIVSLSSDESQGIIRWEAPLGIDYSNATVMISGTSGDTMTRSFSNGEAIELYGDLPDGVYNWETVITPEVSASVKEEMNAVRALGNPQAEKELIAQLREDGSLPTLEQAEENRQSGSFIVLDGIVRPSLVDDPNTGEVSGN